MADTDTASKSHENLEKSAAEHFGMKYRSPQRVAFVVNNDRSFLSHRASWAAALQAGGASVRVMSQDTGSSARVKELGFSFRSVNFGREGVGPLRAATAAVKVLFLLIIYRPQLVFLSATSAYTIGWPAAILLRRATFVRLVNGVGRALEGRSDRTASSRVVTVSLKLSSRLSNCLTVFQLSADRDRFVQNGLASVSRSVVIGGAGVDTKSWTPDIDRSTTSRDPSSPLRVLFASRLFDEKGVPEFVELAKRLASERFDFYLVGLLDSGVDSATELSDVEAWQRAGWLTYWGHRTDMLQVYRSADVFVLPSRHPEGTPKAVIEASSCGLVSVVSDQPGCRATVEHGVTGYVMDVARIDDWEAALLELQAAPARLERMSIAARAKASREFDIRLVLGELWEFLSIPQFRDADDQLEVGQC